MLRKTDEAYKRMEVEYDELLERCNKLEAFISKCRKSEVEGVSLDEIHLMEEQAHHMWNYKRVLGTRLYRVKE